VLIGGWNLVVGHSGQLSIGHVGLFWDGLVFAILAGTTAASCHHIAVSGALCEHCAVFALAPSSLD
jgi:ABC-type branched-subunit amino acid transport system permease subunit